MTEPLRPQSGVPFVYPAFRRSSPAVSKTQAPTPIPAPPLPLPQAPPPRAKVVPAAVVAKNQLPAHPNAPPLPLPSAPPPKSTTILDSNTIKAKNIIPPRVFAQVGR